MDLVDTDILIDIQRGHPPALLTFVWLLNLFLGIERRKPLAVVYVIRNMMVH
jgi:hypothetical protein